MRSPSCPDFFPTNFVPAILEKTAGYVARNGIVFEGMLAFPFPLNTTANIVHRSNPREGKAQPQVLISQSERRIQRILSMATQ